MIELSFQLTLQHCQVSDEILTQSPQVLIADRLLIKALSKILQGDSQSYAD